MSMLRIDMSVPLNKVTVVLGSQWGDEGKGKLVDLLAEEAQVVARCQGGSNAGHRVVVGDVEFNFHLLPSGMANPQCVSLIGNGVVIHLPSLFKELITNEEKGLRRLRERLLISDRAHLVFDFHQEVDGLEELERGDGSLGTTKMGIGPAYATKISRTGIRVAELVGDFEEFTEKFKTLVNFYQKLFPSLEVDVDRELEKYREYAEEIRPWVVESVSYIHTALQEGKTILVEGGQAAMLDIDFGTYPYVTSSNSSIGSVCTGLGIPPKFIGEVIGVVKAYATRVGDGPFPTELTDGTGQLLQTMGEEIGVSTQRTRRCGWLDIPVLVYTTMINGYTHLCLTKLDVLDVLETIKICVAYSKNGRRLEHYPSSASELASVEAEYIELEGWQTSTENIRFFDELPDEAQIFVNKIEEYVGVPVKWIGVGKGRESMINSFL